MSNTRPEKLNGLSEAEAMAFRNKIIDLCKKHGVWYEVFETHKPDLRDITVTTNIKVVGK